MLRRTRTFRWIILGFLLLLLAGILLVKYPRTQSIPLSPDSAHAAGELVKIIEDVGGASAYRYGVTDSAGHTMDTAKIIADPSGGYLAVYHTLNHTFFETHLAASTDLMNWTYQQTYGDRTHQPYLAALENGGFILATETDNGSYNWIQVRYYGSRADLLANQAARTFDVPHTLVPARQRAEGTPNIYTVTLNPDIDHSTIEIGFHYYLYGDKDLQARGTLTNFTTWASQAEPAIDQAIQALGVRGNIGDRDHIIFCGKDFNVQEGQYQKQDFGSWRPFLWDWATQSARELAVRTHGGSLSFANPSLSIVPAPEGGQAVVVSHFVPSENSAPGEAGQLIYYKTIPDDICNPD